MFRILDKEIILPDLHKNFKCFHNIFNITKKEGIGTRKVEIGFIL